MPKNSQRLTCSHSSPLPLSSLRGEGAAEGCSNVTSTMVFANGVSSKFHSDLFADREPVRVVMPEDEGIITIANRGTLSPQRGEGLRVRGETTPVVEEKCAFDCQRGPKSSMNSRNLTPPLNPLPVAGRGDRNRLTSVYLTIIPPAQLCVQVFENIH